MGWFQDRSEAFEEAIGIRRFVILSLAGAVTGFVAWVLKWLSSWGLSVITAAPIEYVAGGVVAAGFLIWWLLEYAVVLKRRLTPQLAVRFEPRDPWIRPTPATTPSANNPNTLVRTQAIFVRLQIENIKPDTVAKGCLVYLTDVLREREPGVFVGIGYGDSLRLAWAARPVDGWFNPLDIPAKTKIFADIFSVDNEHNKMLVKWEQELMAHENLFNEAGTYRFDIAVISGNGPPVTASIGIDWTGEWDKMRAWSIK